MHLENENNSSMQVARGDYRLVFFHKDNPSFCIVSDSDILNNLNYLRERIGANTKEIGMPVLINFSSSIDIGLDMVRTEYIGLDNARCVVYFKKNYINELMQLPLFCYKRRIYTL